MFLPAALEFSDMDFGDAASYSVLGDAIADIDHDGLKAQWDEVQAWVDEDNTDNARNRVAQMLGWMVVQMYDYACAE